MKLIKSNLKIIYLKINFFLQFLYLNPDDKIIMNYFLKIKIYDFIFLNKTINENINKLFYSINLEIMN